jgi:hypothetical protein
MTNNNFYLIYNKQINKTTQYKCNNLRKCIRKVWFSLSINNGQEAWP